MDVPASTQAAAVRDACIFIVPQVLRSQCDTNAAQVASCNALTVSTDQ